MKNTLFISYGKSDRKTALQLYHDLKHAGADPWMDDEDIRFGQ